MITAALLLAPFLVFRVVRSGVTLALFFASVTLSFVTGHR